MGAPAKLSKYAQAPSGTGHFAAALKALKHFEFEERIGNTLVVKEPIGVCGLITPWNWPINQLACKIAPDRKSTRLSSSHVRISYAVFCLKKKNRPYLYFAF